MTHEAKRPEKATQDNMRYWEQTKDFRALDYHLGKNETIEEYDLYLSQLLEPLEEAIVNMNRHGVDYKKSIFDRYIDLEKAVKSVIRKHRRKT